MKLDYHIDQITRKVFRKKDFALAQLITDWDVIVNDELVAKEALPIKIVYSQGKNKDAILHLEVSGVLAPIISQKETEIISNIASFFGHKAIKKIKIIHK